jgi:hypothetical protein
MELGIFSLGLYVDRKVGIGIDAKFLVSMLPRLDLSLHRLKVAWMRPTPTDSVSTRLKLLVCLARTGVNTPETMSSSIEASRSNLPKTNFWAESFRIDVIRESRDPDPRPELGFSRFRGIQKRRQLAG